MVVWEGFPKNDQVNRPYVDGLVHGTVEGCIPTWASNSTITISAGQWVDAASKKLFALNSAVTLNLAASGAGGLDTGSEAADTFYFLWLIGASSIAKPSIKYPTIAILSASGTAPTLPEGYGYKKLLPVAFRNNGSSNLIKMNVANGWPYRPLCLYEVAMTHYNGTSNVAGPNVVVNNGTATSFTTINDFDKFVPPTISNTAFVHSYATAGDFFVLRDDSTNEYRHMFGSGSQQGFMPLSSARRADYIRVLGTGGLYMDVKGYVSNLA